MLLNRAAGIWLSFLSYIVGQSAVRTLSRTIFRVGCCRNLHALGPVLRVIILPALRLSLFYRGFKAWPHTSTANLGSCSLSTAGLSSSDAIPRISQADVSELPYARMETFSALNAFPSTSASPSEVKRQHSCQFASHMLI